jgi:hypothetical protein
MPIMTNQHFIVILIAVLPMNLMVASCSKPQDSPAYQAACQGNPLNTIELRNKAIEDGYVINQHFNCIDRASFVVVSEEAAQWQATHTPEAIAKRESEFAERQVRDADELASKAVAEKSPRIETIQNIVLRDIDVNTASESDIANVISVGPKVAAEIIDARNKRRFNGWPDLVNRVIGLGSAQTAAYASICGLNVDGKSLDGAPPDASMAAQIYQKFQRHH